MRLTAKTVRDIFLDCLVGENAPDTAKVVAVEGITTKVVFSVEKVESHSDTIKALLDELPDTFFVGNGGGYSFMFMPMDKHRNQWGEQINAQELMLLGIASGYMHYLLPKEVWPALPGGVPYVVVFDEPEPPQSVTFKEYMDIYMK